MIQTNPSGDRTSFDPRRVRFVLSESRSGGNVGAAARALKNLGYSRLALVRPQCDPLGREARMMAVEAVDLLERAAIHETLDAALDEAGSVIGTSRRAGKHRRPHYRLDLFSTEMARLALTGELAVVFGPEDRGLRDAELDRCTHLVHLPAEESFPSFNLSQAILLVAYELRRSALAAHTAAADEPPSGHAEREAMYRHLQEAFRTIGYLQRDSVTAIMRRWRRLLGRAVPTGEEVRLLRGLARQILWTAERAGLPPPPEADDDPEADQPGATRRSTSRPTE